MALDLLEEAHAKLRWMPMPPLFTALAERARKRRIAVKVSAWFGRGEQRAEFVTKYHEQYNLTDITVRVRGGQRNLRDYPHALILAHEMGHHLAWERKEEHAEYTRVALEAPETIPTWACSSPERAGILLNAEAVAWAHAVDELRDLGFTRWDRFSRVALASFETYRRAVRSHAVFGGL